MSLCSINPFNLRKQYGPRRIAPGDSYDHFHSSLKTLGLATGFQHVISPYVIRRETGNVMNVSNISRVLITTNLAN